MLGAVIETEHVIDIILNMNNSTQHCYVCRIVLCSDCEILCCKCSLSRVGAVALWHYRFQSSFSNGFCRWTKQVA